jgi:hypothetical protein
MYSVNALRLTNVYTFDSLWEVAPRIFSFTGSDLVIDTMEPSPIKEKPEGTYSNNFSPNKCEGSLCQNSPPAQKPAFCASDAIELNKWSRVLPIAESNPIVIWSTCKIVDPSKNAYG